MAEIRVRPKRRSLAWLWVLLLVLIVAAVGWFLYMNNVIVFRARQTGAVSAPTTVPTATVADASAGAPLRTRSFEG